MIITRTPLRISFAGGGTDFPDFYRRGGGRVISTAINKYIYVIAKKRFDSNIYVGYLRKEIVTGVNDIQHELVRETMKLTGVTGGVEIVILADIPSSGSGLGSSSSLTVGLLHALHVYRGREVSPEQLAREACRVEIDILGKPIGKQDQYIAAYGGFRHIVFAPDDTVRVEDLKMAREDRARLSGSLMLIYTGISRKSEDILSDQKDKIPRKLSLLDDMNRQALDLKQALENNDHEYLGSLLKRAWENKKKLAENITNAQIDSLYDTCIKNGALGGKVCGAGGGGFLLVYCPPGRQRGLREALREYRVLEFGFEGRGSAVIFRE